MTPITEKTTPQEKIFKSNAFWGGIYLGGPLIAGYLFSKNFKAFGQQEKVKPTWIITIIATIVIFGGAIYIPESVKIPNLIIPIAYTAIAISLFQKYQAEKVKKHIQLGGPTYGAWRVITVAIIGFACSIAPFFAIAYTSDAIYASNFTSKLYGDSIKHEITFNKSNISELNVDEFAEGFRQTGFFDLSVPKYVYLEKNDEIYEISISVVPGIEYNEEALATFTELKSQLEYYVPGRKIEFKLVVDDLDNVATVLK